MFNSLKWGNFFLRGNAVWCASDIFLWYSTAKRENCCAYTTKWWSIVRAYRGFIPFFLPSALPLSLFFPLFLCLFCLIMFSRWRILWNWYLISKDSTFCNIFTYTRKLLLVFSQQSDDDGKRETEIFPLVKIFASLNIGVHPFHSVSLVGFDYVAS